MRLVNNIYLNTKDLLKMKNLLLILLSFTLLVMHHQIIAQNSVKTLLKVGDKAPALNAYKWIKGNPVKDFKKGKVYLVDFGATWCVPCAQAIPHLTQLASKYKNEVDVVGVFVMEAKKDSKDLSYVPRVEQYVSQKGDNLSYNVAIDNPAGIIENDWLHAAELTGIPQAFIIDKDGLIAWIGVPNAKTLNELLDYVNSDNYDISDAIQGSKMQKAMQRPVLDERKSLFQDGNGDEANFLYRSILTKYKGEKGLVNFDYVHSKRWIKTPDGQSLAGVQEVNVSLAKLYFMAYADTINNLIYTRQPELNMEYPDTIASPDSKSSYGKIWYRPIWEVRDKNLFVNTGQYLTKKYNYSLLVSNENVSAKSLQLMMRNELMSHFGYEVSVEERLMPYWKLVVDPKAKEKLKAKAPGNKYAAKKVNDSIVCYTNAITKDVLMRLIIYFSYSQIGFDSSPKKEGPFVDETGISGNIDYNITRHESEELRKGNWEVALKFLHRQGFDLVEDKRMTKVVVIKDPVIK
jgi:uncharacterized protein (TIGR03435 family)